jgi:hypothetical protein
MAEEIVDEIAPSRTEPKFGALDTEERAVLSRLVEDLHTDLAAIRAHIENLRCVKGGKP